VPFKSLGVVSYSPSIATMAISCIVCEIWRLIGRKSRKFYTHLYLAPPLGVTPSEFREDLGVHKTRMNGLSCDEEIMTIYSAVLIPCQRVTDGQTDRRPAYIYYVLQHIADARKN